MSQQKLRNKDMALPKYSTPHQLQEESSRNKAGKESIRRREGHRHEGVLKIKPAYTGDKYGIMMH